MYDFISQRFGHQAGIIITGLWIGALLLLILTFGGTPETTLRYLNL